MEPTSPTNVDINKPKRKRPLVDEKLQLTIKARLEDTSYQHRGRPKSCDTDDESNSDSQAKIVSDVSSDEDVSEANLKSSDSEDEEWLPPVKQKPQQGLTPKAEPRIKKRKQAENTSREFEHP